MIDPSKIDALIVEARERDDAVCEKLKGECARLATFGPGWKQASIRVASDAASGLAHDQARPEPEDGSFAIQLFSAIMFAIDARAELKLLEMIASPNFYSAMMRSAAEAKP